METKRKGLFDIKRRQEATVAPAETPTEEPIVVTEHEEAKKKEPVFPPDPFDTSDGWPRVVIVKYAEPNPDDPDDPAKAMVKIAWSVLGTDVSGAADMLADVQGPIRAKEREALTEMFQVAASRIQEAEAKSKNENEEE